MKRRALERAYRKRWDERLRKSGNGLIRILRTWLGFAVLILLFLLTSCGTSPATSSDAPGEEVSRGAPLRGPSTTDGGGRDSLAREAPIFSRPDRDAREGREVGEVEARLPEVPHSDRADSGIPDSRGLDGVGVGPEVGTSAADAFPAPDTRAPDEVGPEVGTSKADASSGPDVLRCRPECFLGCNVGCRDDGQCAACPTCTCDVTTGSCHC
jgi:hypothetical protein